MFKWIRKNKATPTDTASSTLIAGIYFTILGFIVLTITMDLTKNMYLKNAQNSQAQQSVEAAVKTIDSRGSVTKFTIDGTYTIPDSVYKVESEYKKQGYGEYLNKYFSGNAPQARYDETEAYEGANCAIRPVIRHGDTTPTDTQLPYMLITLDTNRNFSKTTNGVVFEIIGNNPPQLVQGAIDYNTVYKVVSATIVDSKSNLLLGIMGMPCQDYNSTVSAVAFNQTTDF